MSIRHRKATLRYYVVSTGYTADDLLDSGEASVTGTVRENTEWPDGYTYSWFETEEAQLKHPAMAAKTEASRIYSGRTYIDGASGLDIGKMHSSKAMEARSVKFDSVTDLSQLPFLSAELDLQPGKTLAEMADEVWAEHIADAAAEAQRTKDKRDL